MRRLGIFHYGRAPSASPWPPPLLPLALRVRLRRGRPVRLANECVAQQAVAEDSGALSPTAPPRPSTARSPRRARTAARTTRANRPPRAKRASTVARDAGCVGHHELPGSLRLVRSMPGPHERLLPRASRASAGTRATRASWLMRTDCVSPNDPDHCSNCATVCPPPASSNGSATCASGACGIACDPGFFVCNSDCHSATASPTDACVVTEQFAVFVSTKGTDLPTSGTRAAPYATIGYAVQNSKSLPRVYVCGGTYSGSVTIGAGAPALSIFGGFSCGSSTTWTYAPASQSVEDPAAGRRPRAGDHGSRTSVDHREYRARLDGGDDSRSLQHRCGGDGIERRGELRELHVQRRCRGGRGPRGHYLAIPLPPPLPGNGADPLTNNGGVLTAECVCPYGASSYGGSGGAGGVAPADGVSGLLTVSAANGAAAVANSGCTNGQTGATAAPAATDGSGASALGSVVGSTWTPSSGAVGSPGGTAQGAAAAAGASRQRRRSSGTAAAAVALRRLRWGRAARQ